MKLDEKKKRSTTIVLVFRHFGNSCNRSEDEKMSKTVSYLLKTRNFHTKTYVTDFQFMFNKSQLVDFVILCKSNKSTNNSIC